MPRSFKLLWCGFALNVQVAKTCCLYKLFFHRIHLQMTVLLWSRCRNRSYSVFWSLLLITSAMSIKHLMSRCVITWPDVITNAKPIREIPTHSHPNPFVLICNLLLRNSLFVGRKNLLSLLSNLRVMGSFVEKRHGLMPNLMEMLLKNFLQTCVQWGIQGRGLVGPPPYFLTKLRPEGRKKFFLETGSTPPPLYLRVWMTGLHRCPKDVPETS